MFYLSLTTASNISINMKSIIEAESVMSWLLNAPKYYFLKKNELSIMQKMADYENQLLAYSFQYDIYLTQRVLN